MKTIEDVRVYELPEDLVPPLLSPDLTRNRSNQKSRIRRDLVTLDIETTTEDVPGEGLVSYIYQWQVCAAGTVIFGRTAETLMLWLRQLADELSGDRCLVYVHNLGYEWQFLAQYIQRDLGLGPSLFVSPRKPLFVRTDSGIEFRDSYRLTGKGLEAFSKGCAHEKKKELLDYRRIRRPWDELTEEELSYCLRDALGLWEALERQLADHGDNPATIPLTMTGYTRRYMKRILRGSSRYHKHLPDWMLPKDAFRVANESGRGGNTHSNRHHTGDILEKMGGADIQSSYPAQILLQPYPYGKVFEYGPPVRDRQELREIIAAGYMFFGRFRLTKVRMKNRHPIPDIPLSKCLIPAKNAALDNGRILSADEVIISMTSIDWEILDSMYSYETIRGVDVWLSELRPLPKVYRDAVFEKFADKSILKYTGTDTEEKKRAYDLSKVVVNGIFGMAYMNPVREEVVFRPESMTYEIAPSKLDTMTEEEFKKLQRNYPWSYLWGLWTSALGRKQLHEAICAIGFDRVVYCDTDSIKFTGGAFPEELKVINERIRARAEELGYIARVGDREFVPGVWEDESGGAPYLYEEFRTLGAKKYAYTLADGSFHTIVSGIGKKEGAAAFREIARKKGISPVEAFFKGSYVADAGGFKASYDYHPIRDLMIEGHPVPAASCIVAETRDYTISLTSEYENLIESLHPGESWEEVPDF